MNKFLNKKIKRNEAGFTIMETMVAIFILVLSITGPLVFSQTALRTSFVARDQMIAFYLAQDAIETIKNLRDQNLIDADYWLEDNSGFPLPGTCNLQSEEECSLYKNPLIFNMDTTDNSITTASFDTCNNDSDSCPLYRNSDKQYTPESSGNDRTSFYRKIYLREIHPGQEAQIIVEVSWDTNAYQSGTRRIIVQENIFNWLE